jgi:predicted methyltransferase
MPTRRFLATALLVLTAMSAVTRAQRPTHGRLFPPDELGILESPDRDEWQQPERIMDALRIADGSRVADIGAGGGWFTIRLAARVGPNGRVYAQDVQPLMIDSIRQRVANRRLTNVETILATEEDPHLPAGLDAVLVVDAYPQFGDGEQRVPVLRKIAATLAPHGRLGIVDFKLDGVGGTGPPLEERLDPAVVRSEAERAGLRLLREETFLPYQYLLVFGR